MQQTGAFCVIVRVAGASGSGHLPRLLRTSDRLATALRGLGVDLDVLYPY